MGTLPTYRVIRFEQVIIKKKIQGQRLRNYFLKIMLLLVAPKIVPLTAQLGALIEGNINQMRGILSSSSVKTR